MTIQNNKITSATEIELYDYWLSRFADIYSFPEYMEKMVKIGVEIKEG